MKKFLKKKKQKKEDEKKKGKDKELKKDEKAKDIVVEFDNIDERIERITPNSSRLGSAIINKDATKLYYMSAFEDT